jgi:recombination protein RecR
MTPLNFFHYNLLEQYFILRIFATSEKESMNQRYPSVLLENAVNELASLPGIGRKTALRLALYMLRRDVSFAEGFASALVALRKEVRYCTVCHNICDDEMCAICSDPRRDRSLVCVVENIKEVVAIENTGQFRGVYHVLGGIISPMDGIGPNDLEIESLVERVASEVVKEVILALSTTMEGDTTNFFIYRKLAPYHIQVSIIARGVSIGDEIEYADEITLGRSIVNRTNFSDSMKGG